MADVVVVGPASWNLIVHVDALPEPTPHMEFARWSRRTLGGTSVGKALHLHQRGREVLLASAVGTDPEGELVAEALRRAGVPLLLETASGPTEQHVNLMDPRGGRLSIYLAVPADPASGALDAALAATRPARAVVLDLSPRGATLIDAVRASGPPLWVDLHDDDGVSAFQRRFADAAQYVFCNADNLADPVAYLRATVARGAQVAVCTLGPDGAVAVDAAGTEHRVAAAPVAQVVDTNGAGDAFFAGFLDATLDGADVPAALRTGAEQAAHALGTVHLCTLLDE